MRYVSLWQRNAALKHAGLQMLPDYIFMILFITEHVAWSPCIDNKCLFIIIIHLIITPCFYTIPLVLLCTLAQGVYVCTSYSPSLWSRWIHQPLSSDFCRCETFQTFMSLLQTFLSKESDILEVIWNSVWVKKKSLSFDLIFSYGDQGQHGWGVMTVW